MHEFCIENVGGVTVTVTVTVTDTWTENISFWSGGSRMTIPARSRLGVVRSAVEPFEGQNTKGKHRQFKIIPFITKFINPLSGNNEEGRKDFQVHELFILPQ